MLAALTTLAEQLPQLKVDIMNIGLAEDIDMLFESVLLVIQGIRKFNCKKYMSIDYNQENH